MSGGGGGLQYHKSTSAGGRRDPVDWEAFDDALARVDPRFSDARFDSLKHVLSVLGSSQAEAELEEVRHRCTTVAGCNWGTCRCLSQSSCLRSSAWPCNCWALVASVPAPFAFPTCAKYACLGRP
jgi:hypothetical protein